MNDHEREAIILDSAWEMINGMVNWGMFERNDLDRPTNLMFQTAEHARLFNILLGDFLNHQQVRKGEPPPLGLLPAPSKARWSNLTFLFHLRQVCANPMLGSKTSGLASAVEAFGSWLEGEFIAEGVNLHSIDIVADLTISRFRYLKMCGDIAKHSLARLAGNVKHLQAVLRAAGHEIDETRAYLGFETFYDWFHRDIFIYHSSTIAEFLNNIRWEIFEYLQPEFRRSYHLMGKVFSGLAMYGYRVPAEINEPVARAMYWGLMNRSRMQPYVHRFVVSDNMKMRY
ncbi:hypothetical protein [Rhizobium leguminosarum]|uniref:hypothetical protein n=1 Tax=Rhizobium leguminosarum TaxID=384 RepID=UPI003F94BCEB